MFSAGNSDAAKDGLPLTGTSNAHIQVNKSLYFSKVSKETLHITMSAHEEKCENRDKGENPIK